MKGEEAERGKGLERDGEGKSVRGGGGEEKRVRGRRGLGG